MTLPTLTFTIKPTATGELQIEVSPQKETVKMPWDDSRKMPGSRRHNQQREAKDLAIRSVGFSLD
jgi:hypothetical protein